MKKVALLAMAAAMLLATPAFADKVKACFAYVGPVGDFGWSYQHDQGRLYAERELGPDALETSYIENVPETADAERVFERLARSGCNIIFATSFGYMDAVNKVAAEFPDVRFEHATGYRRDVPNVSTYSSRFYEGRYVQGVIAASVSDVGMAGYVASFPIPEVITGINAFMLGAQSVDPDFKLKIIWANTWFDPGKEADVAKTLIDQGVDIIAQHTGSTAPMLVAADRGVHAFGQASDMIAFGKAAQLTSTLDNWGPFYLQQIKAVADESWTQHDMWGGMAEDTVVMAPFTNMPDDVMVLAAATAAKIKAGFNPFTGPIFKADGTPWVADGAVAADSELLGLNFYVRGIEDSLPQ